MNAQALLAPEHGQATTTEWPNNYTYPEFAEGNGERYLKKLLRQILPTALYRTWEICADHQAKGNDCYLSIPQLAVLAGRSLRTMQKNIASFQTKQLLVERAERKIFWKADGRSCSRLVVIKDFATLYALAHEYHEWLQAEGTIPPERAFVPLLTQDAALVAKLRRFENYRRLLSNHLPVSGTSEREEDRWFPASPLDEPTEQRESQVHAPTLTVLLPAKEVAKGSPKRINESSHRDETRGDSFDSAAPFFVSVLKETETTLVIARDDREEQAQTENKTPASSALGSFHEETISPASETARAVSDLADSFLSLLCGPFGDQSPKGSQTRLRTLVSKAKFSDTASVLHCLVRAYLVARDTRTIRAMHCSPTGEANRMPLFFAMVQRFLSETAPAENAHWLAVEDALVSDPCLAPWWNEHQQQILLPSRALLDGGVLQAAEKQEKQAYFAQKTAETAMRAPRTRCLSQNDAAREERAALARRVLRRLGRMGVVLQESTVLWEHLACGCPLYHRPQGRDVCVLCFPDPTWPAEALALLRSIVEPNDEQKSEGTVAPTLVEVHASGEQASHVWADRDAAYREALHLLDALGNLGYAVEAFLELVGAWYQVVVRNDQNEWVCTCPEQIAFLIGQVQEEVLSTNDQRAFVCSAR